MLKKNQEERHVSFLLKYNMISVKHANLQYTAQWILPNVYTHVTTTQIKIQNIPGKPETPSCTVPISNSLEITAIPILTSWISFVCFWTSYKRNVYFLYILLLSLKIMSMRSIHIVACSWSSFIFTVGLVFHCVSVPQFTSLFYSRWRFELFSFFNHYKYKYSCNKHSCICLLLGIWTR